MIRGFYPTGGHVSHLPVCVAPFWLRAHILITGDVAAAVLDPRTVMNYQQHLANSAAIRAEIQRFESVHPNIYSIYELLERVEEPLLQNQIREHVIAIEGRTGQRSGGWGVMEVTATV